MKPRSLATPLVALVGLSALLAVPACEAITDIGGDAEEAELNMVNLAWAVVVDSILVNGQRTSTEPHHFSGGRGDHVEPGEATVAFHFDGASRSASSVVEAGDYVGVFLVNPDDPQVRVREHPGGEGTANVLVVNETPGTTVQLELTSGVEGQNHAVTLAYGEAERLEMTAALTYMLTATIETRGDGIMTVEEQFGEGDRFLVLLPAPPTLEGERLFYWKG